MEKKFKRKSVDEDGGKKRKRERREQFIKRDDERVDEYFFERIRKRNF